MAKERVALSLNGVSQHYGAVTAVDDVSLDVFDGEFFALVGPSGSGKTTLLMLIAGFERPQAGSVRIGGRDVGAVLPQDRNIGVVFQNYALFPHMTVERNVGFPLQMRRLGKPERQRRIAAALELVKLADKAKMYPAQLSGGQQQRVALARALVFGPPILLLYEPLGALDRALREEMQIELKRIQQELKITVITVTHDQVEAMSLADRIAVMKDGKLQQIGSPQEMYTKPSTPFIARFVGESSFYRDGSSTIALRPEVIRLAAEGPGLPGTVSSTTYFGPLWRVAVDLSDGQNLVAAVPGTPRPYSVGDHVNVSWAASDAVQLAPSEPESTTPSHIEE
jgi:putative spermidine/putrescine transport system ATP-binding protein